MLPFWARVAEAEAEAQALLVHALDEVEAPDDQYERLGLS
jgi:hypothetical protein